MREFFGLADLMALLMVAATAFSAIATWRATRIADAIYRVAERPYLGVEQVEIDRTFESDPRIVVHYKNFGPVAAEDSVLRETISVDGKSIAKGMTELKAGILSPSVPHRLHAHLAPDDLDAVVQRGARLIVDVDMHYRGPGGGLLCYREQFLYIGEARMFEPHGGTPRCEERMD